MPAYPYLFEMRKAGTATRPKPLALAGDFAPPKGYEVVPRPDGEALVAYLMSLKRDVSLYEAPASSPARAFEDMPTAPAGRLGGVPPEKTGGKKP
jgi:hypothetical protein